MSGDALKRVTSSESLLALLDQAARDTAAPTEQSEWTFGTATKETQDLIQRRFEEKFITEYATKYRRDCQTYDLTDPIPFFTDAMQTLVEDDFTKCFESKHPVSWNWNFYLFPMWCIGVVVRYLILFPLRLFVLVLGGSIVVGMLLLVSVFVTHRERRERVQKTLLRWLANIFVLSWAGVIRFHGRMPRHKPNQIFVANHTTILDVVVLMQRGMFSLVGQKHPGFMGWMQTHVLSCLGCTWFERTASKDRQSVARALKAHITDPSRNNLLIFPEGVCVNNEYVVMFKKGAFELGASIVPIAIKYNKLFCDPFYNSKTQSFFRHLFNMMTCWAVVCDVWFLEPERQAPGESEMAFANKVQAKIAAAAGLTVVPFDGYLKYYRPSEKFKQHQQKIFSYSLIARFKQYLQTRKGGKTGSKRPSLSTPLSPLASQMEDVLNRLAAGSGSASASDAASKDHEIGPPSKSATISDAATQAREDDSSDATPSPHLPAPNARVDAPSGGSFGGRPASESFVDSDEEATDAVKPRVRWSTLPTTSPAAPVRGFEPEDNGAGVRSNRKKDR